MRAGPLDCQEKRVLNEFLLLLLNAHHFLSGGKDRKTVQAHQKEYNKDVLNLIMIFVPPTIVHP